jgi:beta-lactamase superfamily II metal-dependent hydrolase
MAIKPKKVTLRTYQVGFGDCFLFSVKYSDNSERHILIDFGTTELPKYLNSTKAVWMKKIAENIKERCGGNLDIIVATHRHADHISGFAPDKHGKGSGKIIADCQPKLIIQPWTEDPQLPMDAKKQRDALVDPDDVKNFSAFNYQVSLDNMQVISAVIVKQAQSLGDTNKYKQVIKSALKEQIEFIGIDNISNKAAVKNLGTMGENVYVHYGYDLNAKIKDILPGIKAKILGPPTMEQHEEVEHQAHKNKDEFWHLQALSKNFWGMQAATSELTEKLITGKETLFPDAVAYKKSVPSHNRWFVRQLRKIRAEQLLGIATTMDDALNNTSLILLFEIGGKKFLFPGDAQIENWEYCLKFAKDKAKNLKLLGDTFLYKVGHHGSLNATPQTLWKTFGNKKNQPRNGDDSHKIMTSVVSTMGDENGEYKHGDPAKDTEVPRETLVKALEESGEYFTTRTLRDPEKFFKDIEFEID